MVGVVVFMVMWWMMEVVFFVVIVLLLLILFFLFFLILLIFCVGDEVLIFLMESGENDVFNVVGVVSGFGENGY